MFDSVKAYVAGAVCLLIIGLALFAGWQYEHARKTEADMAKLTEDMHNTQASLTQLQKGVTASNDAITHMSELQAQVTQHGSVVRARVQTLRSTNDAIRTYLDTPLPNGGCMLDDTCPVSGTGPAAVSGAASAVR